VTRLALALVVVSLSALAEAQDSARTLQLDFTASADGFRVATDEYRAIWAKEGPRIVAAMERITGLRFEPGPVPVTVYEGTSFSGRRGGPPMVLRASYPEPTKRGTLVHELGHRLAADVPFKGEHHELIFLFVYDVWVDLWGKPFADEQVTVESQRRGLVDYEGTWKKTLAMSQAERASRLQEIVKSSGR
jgi:hypothetical protein